MGKARPDSHFESTSSHKPDQISDPISNDVVTDEQQSAEATKASQFEKLVITCLKGINETCYTKATEYEKILAHLQKNSIRVKKGKSKPVSQSTLDFSEQIEVFEKATTLYEHVNNLNEALNIVLKEITDANANKEYDNFFAIGTHMQERFVHPLINNVHNLRETIFEQFRINIDKQLKKIERDLKATTLESDPAVIDSLQAELNAVKEYLREINQANLFAVFNITIDRLDAQIDEHQKALKTNLAELLESKFFEIDNLQKQLSEIMEVDAEQFLNNFHQHLLARKNEISELLSNIKDKAFSSTHRGDWHRYMDRVDTLKDISESLEDKRIEFLTSIENEEIAKNHMRNELDGQKKSWSKAKDRIDFLDKLYSKEVNKFATSPWLQKHETAAEKIALINKILERMVKNKEYMSDEDFLTPKDRKHFPLLLSKNLGNLVQINNETEQSAEDLLHLIEELEQIRKERMRTLSTSPTLSEENESNHTVEENKSTNSATLEPTNSTTVELPPTDEVEDSVATPAETSSASEANKAGAESFEVENLNETDASSALETNVTSLHTAVSNSQINEGEKLENNVENIVENNDVAVNVSKTEVGDDNKVQSASHTVSQENIAGAKSFGVENLNETDASSAIKTNITPLHTAVDSTQFNAVEKVNHNDVAVNVSKTEVLDDNTVQPLTQQPLTQQSLTQQPLTDQPNKPNNLKSSEPINTPERKANNQLRMMKDVRAILDEINGEREKRGIKRVYRKFVNFLLKLISPKISREKEKAFKELRKLLIRANKTKFDYLDPMNKPLHEQIEAWRKANESTLEQRRGLLRFFSKTSENTSSLKAVKNVIEKNKGNKGDKNNKGYDIYVQKRNLRSRDLK